MLHQFLKVIVRKEKMMTLYQIYSAVDNEEAYVDLKQDDRKIVEFIKNMDTLFLKPIMENLLPFSIAFIIFFAVSSELIINF